MFIELLLDELMWPVYAAAVLLSVVAGVVGSLVVSLRLSFLAGGVAHSAYGGIGIAAWFSLPILPAAGAFSVAVALLMGAITRQQRERTDAVIGALWASGMALGMVLLDKLPGYQADMMSYLTGSLLLVGNQELGMMLLIDLMAVLFVVSCYRALVLLAFEEEYAKSVGIRVGLLHSAIMVLIGLTVIVAMKMVGLILLLALLTIPPYLAEQKSQSLAQMMGLATLYALGFSLGGVLLALYLDTQVGPTIILLATAVFLLKTAPSWLAR